MRKILSVITGVLLLCFVTRPASALIDTNLQMQLGNPSGATSDPTDHHHYLLVRTVEALDYNDSLGEPNWVSWDLTTGDVGNTKRSDNYSPDPNLPTTPPPAFYRVTDNDYNGVGAINFNRGHMCPSEDRTDNVTDNSLLFLMSNIIPQAAANNQGVWGNFEAYCRSQANAGNEILIICGPSLFSGTFIPSGRAAIAQYNWKIAVIVPLGSGTALSRITAATRVISLKIPNSNNVTANWPDYVTSASQIEVDTGFRFFTALPTDVAAALRAKVDGQSAPPPSIASFSPASGAAGDTVIITGLNLSSPSAVTFNGVGTAFTPNSATQITATVPVNATTGLISVTTPGGTALSTSNFTVTGSVVDLAITAAHSGIFSQGDHNDIYTITVTNLGTVPSSGTVTVADALPSGLIATAISGTGWSADLASLTCTRSDGLPAGSSFPPIVLIVNVATNALASVTNIVTVSGGGDINSANNTASDLTSINGALNTSNLVTLAAWDMSALPGGTSNYGPSPFAPGVTAPNLTVTGLTRGSGVGLANLGAARGWGGNTFNSATTNAAIAASQFVTFGFTANAGYSASYSVISKFDYRHSATGPPSGLLQYQIGTGGFNNIQSLSYPTNGSALGSMNPIDLSGVSALQNVGPGIPVTFRIVNFGGTSSGGTWYIFDVSGSTAADFVVQGTVTSLNSSAADLQISSVQNGIFTQGDSDDSYTITVNNVGTAATTGAVTVTDLLPAGLIPTAITGDGWTTNLATLTCTRSDALAIGASYPPITIFVNVATNAPGTVTNLAIVSGGAETNSANNSFSQATTIIALTPVQAWRQLFFGTSVNSGPAADDNISSSDGMPNLLKYAFGLNPLVATNNPMVGDVDTGFLRVTLPKNPDATDISFHVELTGDLNAPWTTNGTTIDQNTSTLLQVHDNTPVNSATTNGFMRLRVSRP